MSKMVSEKVREKARALRNSSKAPEWITLNIAIGKVAEALRFHGDLAEAILFGLIASENLRAGNAKGELLNNAEVTISDLYPNLAFVSHSDLQDWLREHSNLPLTRDRDNVIAELLTEGKVPARTIPWKDFDDEVRDRCNGWLGKGPKRRPARGFEHRTIQRSVKARLER